MKRFLSLAFMMAVAVSALTSCCADRNPCCEPCPPAPRCCEPKPCRPQPCAPQCETRYMDNNCCY